MGTDFEAEGLLEDLSGEERAARLELLLALEEQGYELEELRRAASEDRLALLPVEHVLEAEGPRYSLRQVAEEVGFELAFLQEARRALGQPIGDPDALDLTQEDLDLARQAAILLASGIDREAFLELTRVMSHAMANVAAALIGTLGQSLLRPGDTERDLGLRYADSLRRLGPLAGPALTAMLNIRLRESIREAAVGRAELERGRLPGSQPVCVAFVDIVGFTELGEQVEPDELGRLVTDFERRVEALVHPPLRLVKTIGDAAMLASPDADALLEAALALVIESREDEDAPLLRAGAAFGEALSRAGDLYGRPVNLASRLTAFARRGTVVVSADLKERARGDYDFSAVGRRRLRGVDRPVEIFRVRPPG